MLKQSLKNNSIYILLLSFFFSIFLFINRQNLFRSFDSEVISKYLRSQDIFDETSQIKDRIFVSDEEIYIASGYLYVNGAKPTDYNFQHPPFIKYLFGFSAKYFNMPLLPNIIFALFLVFEIFILGKLVFKNYLVGFLASILIMLDPVFKEVATYALLDLGQMTFILGFIITSLFFEKKWVLQGLLLGLAMASKFYSPVIILLGIIYLYKLFNKSFAFRQEFTVLIVASLVFGLTYIVNFPFNIFFEQAKIIKFMLDHNKAVEWGEVLPMFFGGYLLWPILFFVNALVLLKVKFNILQFLFNILPIACGVILLFQLPFTRYFILMLPFLYLTFTNLLLEKFRSKIRVWNLESCDLQ